MSDMNPTDHDLLIRLDEKFETFTKQYHLDMKALNDGVSTKLAEHIVAIKEHEKRLDEHQRIIDIVKPEDTYKDFLGVKKQINDFIVSANAYRLAAGFIGGGIMYLLVQIPTILKLWDVNL